MFLVTFVKLTSYYASAGQSYGQLHCNWNLNASSRIGISILFLKIIGIGEM